MTRRLAATAAAVALVVVFAAQALAVADRYLHSPVDDDGVITLLLLGSDQGPYRGGNPLRGRADAFHLLFVSPDRQHVTFVNVPRDAYVPVPGRGRDRINACLVGGPQRCVDTVRSLWGVEVDHWLLTDFRGLDEAVDRLGGVAVHVERPLFDGGEDIRRAGRQRLSGAQALAYTRDRKHRPGGDFARTAAQTRLLQAAHAQLVHARADVGRIAETVAIVQQTTITDAAPVELLRLAYLAVTIPPTNVDSVTLGGGHGRAGGAAVVLLADRSHAIVRDVAADGVVGTAGGSAPG